MYTTKTQAVQNVSKLLKAHGYDPAAYDLLSIADEYRQETGGYESIFDNPGIVWAYVDQHHAPATDTPPANFVPRDWDAPEHADIAPRDRYEVYDGPEHGGVVAVWQPDDGVTVDVDHYCKEKGWLTMDLSEAKRLHADLTKVLAKIDQ